MSSTKPQYNDFSSLMPKGGKLLSFFAIENMQKAPRGTSVCVCVCVRVASFHYFNPNGKPILININLKTELKKKAKEKHSEGKKIVLLSMYIKKNGKEERA